MVLFFRFGLSCWLVCLGDEEVSVRVLGVFFMGRIYRSCHLNMPRAVNAAAVSASSCGGRTMVHIWLVPSL